MKYKIKNSILMQLLLLVAVITLIPLLILAIMANDSYKKNIQAKITAMNFEHIRQIDKSLYNIANEVNSIINTYNNSALTQAYLTETYASPYERIKASDELEHVMSDYMASLNWLDCDLILLGENNNIFTTSHHVPRLSASSIYQSYWYKESLKKPERIHWFVFDRSYFSQSSKKPVIVAAKMLMNQVSHQSYGTIVIEMDDSVLYDSYMTTVNEKEIVMIRNAEGNILTTNDHTVSPSLDPSSYSIPIGKEGATSQYHYNGTSYICLNVKSLVSDWYISKLIPMRQINDEIKRLQINFLQIYVFCLVLIIMGIYVTAIRLSRPINALSAKLRGYFVNQNASVSPLSVKNTITSYELLMDEVNETLEKLMEENELRRKAELHALELQINPHFLYNTLNSIKCLVWTKQYNAIEPTLTALVKLLQQTLRRDEELISLELELENLKNYLFIQKIRTDGSITVNYDIRPSYYGVRIPFLVLQPIVENAIFHGLEPKGYDGVITISAYRDKEDFCIEVLDNGIGMSSETIQQLLNYSSEKKRGSGHIGLKNVDARIKMYFGSDYGIQIESKCNLGTVVTLRMRLL